jgi:hypothetical protein
MPHPFSHNSRLNGAFALFQTTVGTHPVPAKLAPAPEVFAAISAASAVFAPLVKLLPALNLGLRNALGVWRVLFAAVDR